MSRRRDWLTWGLIGIGVLLLSYPLIARPLNARLTSWRLAQATHQLQQNAQAARTAEAAENARLAQNGLLPNAPDFIASATQDTDLASHLIGVVMIPKLTLQVPLYDQTSAAALARGVGVVPGTSFPLGGASRHSVIAGHNGLVNQVLFTHLDQLKRGDRFSITVGATTRVYQVERIRTVLPAQADALTLEPGRDLVTLLTCTPFMVNDHRLLVTGHRVPLTTAEKQANAAVPERQSQRVWLIGAAAAVLLLLGSWRARWRYRNRS
ncbi:class C sortase [Lacticaseibacillus daqingensis]|uniref:class C sortase n=1 Tax=Lacticaseibacillus daqingensis TaxID=2486014 RepID=UPI000F792517|nr:class C sortase [Lacticaseibacillus daqingensis]